MSSTSTVHGQVEQDGFAIVPEVFSHREVRVLLLELAKLPHGRAGIRHLMSTPVVSTVAKDRRMIKLAENVLNSTALPFRATLFDKSQTANWKVMWHQDTALPLRARIEGKGWGPWSVKEGINYAHAPTSALRKVVALRLNLDGSKTTNGPLRVVPGTHALGVLSDDEVERISAGKVGVNCLGEPGSVVVMRPLVFHSSLKATSDEPRRVLHIEYASTTKIDGDLELAVV